MEQAVRSNQVYEDYPYPTLRTNARGILMVRVSPPVHSVA